MLVYLLSKLLPVTIFYFIFLIPQINLTTAPMVSFIFYSHVVFVFLNHVMLTAPGNMYESDLCFVYPIDISWDIELRFLSLCNPIILHFPKIEDCPRFLPAIYYICCLSIYSHWPHVAFYGAVFS